MNFYKLIKQQYDDYKITLEHFNGDLHACKNCPCKTLRNRVFGTNTLSTSCSAELLHLMNICNIRGGFSLFFCDDSRKASLEIAKKLFGKEGFNKI